MVADAISLLHLEPFDASSLPEEHAKRAKAAQLESRWGRKRRAKIMLTPLEKERQEQVGRVLLSAPDCS